MMAKHTLYLNRLGAKIYSVDDSNKAELEFDYSNSAQIIEKLKTYHQSVFRLLLSDQLSYLFKITIPIVDKSKIKPLILEKVKGLVPDNFSELSWDYQITNSTDTEYQLTIFAPTSDIDKIIKTISTQLNIFFEAIIPETIAAYQNPNPIVGLITKNDLNLSDEKSLNLTYENNQKSTSRIWLLIPILLIILAVILAINYKNKLSPYIPNLASTPTPSIVLQTPTLQPKRPSQLSIIIQNGSGVTGAAAKLADTFYNNGFLLVNTQNASNSAFVSTQVIYKQKQDQILFDDQITTLLNHDPKNIFIDNSQESDVIVIIGKD